MKLSEKQITIIVERSVKIWAKNVINIDFEFGKPIVVNLTVTFDAMFLSEDGTITFVDQITGETIRA